MRNFEARHFSIERMQYVHHNLPRCRRVGAIREQLLMECTDLSIEPDHIWRPVFEDGALRGTSYFECSKLRSDRIHNV